MPTHCRDTLRFWHAGAGGLSRPCSAWFWCSTSSIPSLATGTAWTTRCCRWPVIPRRWRSAAISSSLGIMRFTRSPIAVFNVQPEHAYLIFKYAVVAQAPLAVIACWVLARDFSQVSSCGNAGRAVPRLLAGLCALWRTGDDGCSVSAAAVAWL